jgi:glutamate/aspartate transport system substrate-binding protein
LKFVIIAIVMSASITAKGEELSGTLKKIYQSGSISLGVRDFTIPFSYLDDQHSYQGYTIDICTKVAIALQKKLGLTKIEIKLVPVTPSTHIPLLANGTIDLECGNTTNKIERQKQVSFSPTIFVASGRLITRTSDNINSIRALKNKTVAATSGSFYLKIIAELSKSQNLDLNLVAVRDTAEGSLMVENGRATAYAQDDIVLASLRASSKNPENLTIMKDIISVEPLAIMLRRSDPEFKRAVDSAVVQIFNSGELTQLYKKWFQSPIPPKGINLGHPMSPELRAVIAKPTDSSNPSDYAISTEMK